VKARLLAATAAVLAIAGTAGWWAARPDRAAPPTPSAELPTTPVTRGDLVATTQQPGRLGYGAERPVVGQRAGTVTAAPGQGQVLQRGDRVYGVDGRPIPLCYGDVPFYRPLAPGSEGADVRQLEENLIALGLATHSQVTIDDRYTAATAAAVRRWQDRLGVAQTGHLAPGDAVVAPGAVRVSRVDVLVGGPANPGTAVLAATGTIPGVYLDLPLAAQSYARAGQEVEVLLPQRRTANGAVASVGSAAVTPAAPQNGTAQQAGGQSSPCEGSSCPQAVTVEIRLTGPPAELGGLTQAPVNVTFRGETRRDVLSVPIEALTVAPDGRFAVVVRADGQRRTVPVSTGLFTAGRVEVTGDGLAEGALVEVPGP
jgi:peptidoglycan hydrolase-like protein with peptidoglycan-binding domain